MFAGVMRIIENFDVYERLDKQLTGYFANPLHDVHFRQRRHVTCHVPSSHSVDQIFKWSVTSHIDRSFVQANIVKFHGFHHGFILIGKE